MTSKAKPKPCKICRDQFTPFNSTDPVCAKYECRVRFAEEHVRKSQEKRLKAQRKEVREKKQKLKTKSEWLKEFQVVFNKFIRLRDAALPCISCQRFHSGQYHAGHYRTVGSAPHLRFNEQNCHKQCAPCNNHLSGNIVNYRAGLIERIGASALDAIEADNKPKHYTIDDIKQLIAEYKAKIKEMEACHKD